MLVVYNNLRTLFEVAPFFVHSVHFFVQSVVQSDHFLCACDELGELVLDFRR